MKITARFYSLALFAAALVVLVAANGLVLTGVSANRSGTPEAQLVLTERELHLPHWVSDENSGLALRLSWRTLPLATDDNHYAHRRSPAWFDAQKLAELGFDVARLLSVSEAGATYQRPLPKEVYLVFELDGRLYQESVRRHQAVVDAAVPAVELFSADVVQDDNLKRAERSLQRERIERSRLFAVDAGLDPLKLRRAYPDRQRFIITRGQIRPITRHDEPTTTVVGVIEKVGVTNVHVPLELRPLFESLEAAGPLDSDAVRGPRYQVTLAYGSRFEPWVVAVKLLGAPADAVERGDDGD